MSLFKDRYGDYKTWAEVTFIVVVTAVVTSGLVAVFAYAVFMPIDKIGCKRYGENTNRKVKYDSVAVQCYVNTDRGWVTPRQLIVNRND